jgi:hypothetical protein
VAAEFWDDAWGGAGTLVKRELARRVPCFSWLPTTGYALRGPRPRSTSDVAPWIPSAWRARYVKNAETYQAAVTLAALLMWA